MRRLLWSVVSVVAVTSLALVAPSPARAESSAVCALDIQLVLAPGLTLLPGSGSISSPQNGSLNCVGVINGGVVNGPGTFAVRGTYRGTCQQGSSQGTAAYSIPTTNGPAGGAVAYTVDWVGTAGFIRVVDPVYGTGSGPFTFVPVRGDCLRAPLTVIRWVSTQITFAS